MKIVQITTDNREYFRDYEAPAPYFGSAPEALLDGLASVSDVEVHVVSCLHRPLPSPEKLAPNIHYHSLVIPAVGWMRTLYCGSSRAVRRLLSEIEPEVVHGQGTERDCAISAVRSGYPNVITVHGNMAELRRGGHLGRGPFGFLASRLETHALQRTSGVFCNSEHTKQLVAPRAARCWLVPNAVRRSFFEVPTVPRAARPAKPQLLCVGLITPYKRSLDVLRAVKSMVREGHACRVVFAGLLPEHTEYGRAFSSELREARAEGYAEHVGYLGMSPLIDLMDQSDACIHFPMEEAFGLVAAESMARGLKFFGARVGGIRDIAAGVDGAEVHDDLESLRAGLVSWMDAGCPMPARAAAQMAERYHPDVIAKRHMAIYEEVLSAL